MIKLSAIERKNIKLNVFVANIIVEVLSNKYSNVNVEYFENGNIVSVVCGVFDLTIYTIDNITIIDNPSKDFYIGSLKDLKRFIDFIK